MTFPVFKARSLLSSLLVLLNLGQWKIVLLKVAQTNPNWHTFLSFALSLSISAGFLSAHVLTSANWEVVGHASAWNERNLAGISQTGVDSGCVFHRQKDNPSVSDRPRHSITLKPHLLHMMGSLAHFFFLPLVWYFCRFWSARWPAILQKISSSSGRRRY